MTYQDCKKIDECREKGGELELRAMEIGQELSKLIGLGDRGKAWKIYHEQPKNVQDIIREKYPVDVRSLQFSAI